MSKFLLHAKFHSISKLSIIKFIKYAQATISQKNNANKRNFILKEKLKGIQNKIIMNHKNAFYKLQNRVIVKINQNLVIVKISQNQVIFKFKIS